LALKAAVADEGKHAPAADGRGGATDDRQQVRVVTCCGFNSRAINPIQAQGQEELRGRSVHSAFEYLVEILLVGLIVFLFPLCPLFMNFTRGATFHTLFGRPGKSTISAMGRHTGILHHQFKSYVPLIVALFIE
jgi:hypothetical protein